MSAHPVTMEETDWRQHVITQGHNGKQFSAIQMLHSCDTIGLFLFFFFDVISSTEQNSE